MRIYSTDSFLLFHKVLDPQRYASQPFKRAPFIPFGGRSTAIRLQDGSVWLLASTKADEETLAKIREIGPVKYICAPDLEHWLNLSASWLTSQAQPKLNSLL